MLISLIYNKQTNLIKGFVFYHALLLFSVNTHRLFLSKIKKAITITNTFPKILDESNHKSSKIWVDKGSEFYNKSIKSWLEKDTIEMYATHNEGKSVVAERFIRPLNNKIYKYITPISKNLYIDKLILFVILTEKKLLEHFMKKIAKSKQNKFIVEKIIKRKGDKLYVKKERL